MSKKRATESSWDSDEELLGDAPGVNSFSKSAELDVLTTEGELEDEDALLGLENETGASHNAGFYNSEQEHVQDEQAFVFEEVDTGDLEDELNVGGDEEAGYQEQVYQGDGDYDESYQNEAAVDSSEHMPDSEGYQRLGAEGESENAVSYDDSQAVDVSYEHAETDTAVELQYDEQDSEREVVLHYGDGGDTSTEMHGESDQPAGEHLESESDSDDEDSRNNRGRFKTERTGVISLAAAKERASIPDTLEIDDEQAAQINKFMSDKPPSQRGGKKSVGGRGGRQSVHSRLGPRGGLGPREAQGPGMLQGPRPPFPLGLQPQINPRMLMGIIRGGGMQALRNMLPGSLMGPRGPLGMRPPGGPRGPMPDGPPGQRGPFPMRPGNRGGMNMRGRMPGPRGPGERGPFPPGLQPRGPFPGPHRGPPPLHRGPPPPHRGPPPLPLGMGPRGPGGPPPRGPPGGPQNMPDLQLRMRGPGPAGMISPNQMRGPPRGPPPRQPMLRPLMPNDAPPVRGMLRGPSPLRGPEPGNNMIRGPSIHDRLGPRVPFKANQGPNNMTPTSGPGTSDEGQPIPSLVKPVLTSTPQQPPGMNEGNRPRPQFNAGLGNNAGLRQPNPRGPRALMSQNIDRPSVGGPNKIFINPRFRKEQDERNNMGITRTVRIGTPLQQRREKGLLDKAIHGQSNVGAKVPVVAMKRRSTGSSDIPNKMIRIGDNQQSQQGQQNMMNAMDDQNQRNVILQRRDLGRDRQGVVRRKEMGKRLGPQVQGEMMGGGDNSWNVPVRGSSSSIQSRLGPPISRQANPTNPNVSFNPKVAPPNFPPRGPPPSQANPAPQPMNPRGPAPPTASMFSKPPPSILPLQGPPRPVTPGHNFTSPPPGSAAPPTRFRGPPPTSSVTARFSAPPPTVNVPQPPPSFSGPPPGFQVPTSQPPPTFHSMPPPVSTPAYPPPAAQVVPLYPPPAVPATVAAYPPQPLPYATQTYAPPTAPLAAAVRPAAQPIPASLYQPVPAFPVPPSHAQSYQHQPSLSTAVTYASSAAYKPTAVPTYQPPQQQPPQQQPPQLQPPQQQPQAQQYSYYDYSAGSAQYQSPQPPVASQAYQAPQQSYPQSSYYDYSSQQAVPSLTTQTTPSSSYDMQAVQHIATIGRRAQPATDSQVRSIIHNVAPSRSSSSSSQSYSSGRVVVDTNVSVLRGPQKVAIYNLAQMATKETLIKVCRHFGRVLNVQLMREENKAVVQFETGDQAAKCVSKCDQRCLHKSRLTVKLLAN